MSLRTESTPSSVSHPATAWGVVAITVLTEVLVAFQLGKLISALPAVSADLGIGLTLGGACWAPSRPSPP